MDNTTLRILKLIETRRKISPEKLAEILKAKNHSELIERLEIALNFLDHIGSDDDLYCPCPHCGSRTPFDKKLSKAETAAETVFCEKCANNLF